MIRISCNRQHATRTILFIAYGNPLRGDDGAGIELARRVKNEIRDTRYEIRLVEFHQLVPELVNEIADPAITALFFFDCRVRDAGCRIQDANCTNENGTIDNRTIELVTLQPATFNLQLATFGHHLTPQTVLELAAGLNGQAPPAWLVTIPGYDFQVGEGFSEAVAHLLNDAPEIARMVASVVSPSNLQ